MSLMLRMVKDLSLLLVLDKMFSTCKEFLYLESQRLGYLYLFYIIIIKSQVYRGIVL